MRWARIVVVVVGSAWFFPVSCTASLFAGTHLVAKLDARDVNKGESVHSRFSMVIESGDNGEPFQVVNLDDLARLGDGATVDAESLEARGLIRGSGAPIKLLGDGESPKNLSIKIDRISAGARSKIEAAGGSVELTS